MLKRTICLWSLLLALTFSSAIFAQKVNKDLLVSTDWLAKNSDKVVLLHVGQNRASYDAGHIPNARYLAYGDVATARYGTPNELAPIETLLKTFTDIGIGNSRKIVIYGDGNGLQAARVFYTLDYLGQGGRTALLDGGLEKWKAEKREISTRNVVPTAESFSPRINPRVVISMENVRAVSWSVVNQNPSNFALVDARPPDEYAGTKAGDGVMRGGHIPGAASVFWLENNLVSRENPVMKPEKELRKTYEAAGATNGKTVVVYCRTGGQASHSYFTLRYLGYDVLMYDGSYFEWNKQADNPIATGDKRN